MIVILGLDVLRIFGVAIWCLLKWFHF
jgi:hypothetical protein